MNNTTTDQTSPRFNLTKLYSNIDSKEIAEDLKQLQTLAKTFDQEFRGNLSTKLGSAVSDLCAILMLWEKISAYVNLSLACDAANPNIQRAASQAKETWSQVYANHLLFFGQEIALSLTEEEYQRQLKDSNLANKHKPYFDSLRMHAKHLLSSDVERALALRKSFGPNEWHEYVQEREVEISFVIRDPALKADPQNKTWWGKKLSLTQALELLLHHDSSEVRFAALRAVNRTLKKDLAPLTTRALNSTLGLKAIEDRERKHQHPMAERNLDNKVSQDVVEALHQAIKTEGAALAKRYYKLLSRILKKDLLLWSDRTASVKTSLGIKDEKEKISWENALQTVHSAWHSFSPTMASYLHSMVNNGWVDAPTYPGKSSGAFNYTVILPKPLGIQSFTFLNYMGSERDVMTVAHEFGHAVHGILASEAQGPLMFAAPMVYAETASIFGEMLVFEHILAETQSPLHKACLLMEKSSDFINSVIRQISFSEFEQRIHTHRKTQKLLSKDFAKHWKAVTVQFYGSQGDVFDYKDIDYLWSYIFHFFSPFYVYAYAFGELLTQSIFPLRKTLGKEFEPLYLDLLRAGSTKDAVQLLAPFGLDPRNADFWSAGLKQSLGGWVGESERILAAE